MFDFKMATSKHILDKSAQKNPKPCPNLHEFPNARGGGRAAGPPSRPCTPVGISVMRNK